MCRKIVSALLLAALCLSMSCGCESNSQQDPTSTKSTSPEVSESTETEPVVTVEPTPTPIPTPEPTPTPTPEPVVNQWVELPSIEEVALEDSPLMWDFLHGCLGWHMDTPLDTMQDNVFLVRNINQPEVVYYDLYQQNEELRYQGLPYMGTYLTVLYFNNEEENARLQKAFAGVPKERVLHDGDWEFYILREEGYKTEHGTDDPSYCLSYYDNLEGVRNTECFGGIPRSKFGAPPLDGLDLSRNPWAQGDGYATEWLRKEPWCTRLKEWDKMDFSDPYWDTWTFEKRHPFFDVNGVQQGHVSPYEVGIFKVTWYDPNKLVPVDVFKPEEVLRMLDIFDYTLPSIQDML